MRRLSQGGAIRPSIGASPTSGSSAVVRRPLGTTNIGQTGIRGGNLNWNVPSRGRTLGGVALTPDQRSLARAGLAGAARHAIRNAGHDRDYGHGGIDRHLYGHNLSYGYGHGYGYGYGRHHHGGYHVAFGLGFGYYPYYYDPYYAYPAYYPGYIAPYGSTVINETTIIDNRPVTTVDPVPPVADALTAAPAPFSTAPAGTTEAPPTAPRPAAPVPGSIEDLLARGDYAFAQGQYAQARALYMQAAVVGPESPHPKFAYALAGFALGDYKAAAVSLRQAMRLFPDLARSEADLREAYRIPGDFERHLNALAEYTNVKDKDPDGWLVLGYIQYFSTARPAGLTSLGKALELAPDDDVVRAFFDTARATPTPPTARPFPPLDPKAQPGDSAPPKSTQPSEGSKPAERSGTSRSDSEPSPVTGSAPGVSVEFSPPASTAKPKTSTETNPA